MDDEYPEWWWDFCHEHSEEFGDHDCDLWEEDDE